jgi:quercetin dioxygenase-like cupin family protein
MLERRAYSILHVLDGLEFTVGIAEAHKSTALAESVQDNLCLTFIAVTTKKGDFMRVPFKKSLNSILREGAHGGSGSRQLILSKTDDVSGKLEAMTKGFLDPSGFFDWHHHEEIDEFFVVLRGKGRVLYKNADGSETAYDYAPDDIFYTPAGIEHRIECDAADSSEYFFVRIAD